MEANLKEKMMKLTKDEITSMYVTAISTIESKDSEIGTYKNRIADLAEEVKVANQELKELNKSDYPNVKRERDNYKKKYEELYEATKDNANLIDENILLKQNYNSLAADREDMKGTLGELIDILDSNFQNMSSSINNAFNGFNIIKNRALKRWGEKVGNK